jgi:peroxiredoxin
MLQEERMALSRCLLALGLVLAACDSDSKDDEDTGAETGTETEDSVAVEYGPDNSWSHALESDIPDGLAGTGFRNDDTANNFTLVDQNGEDIELYQFYGKIVVLDVFAQWCGPCQDNAPEGEDLWIRGEGEVVVIAIMLEATAGVATAEAVTEWVTDFSLTHPVVADPDKSQGAYIVTGYPTYVVIDRDMSIITDDLWPFDSEWVLALSEQ